MFLTLLNKELRGRGPCAFLLTFRVVFAKERRKSLKKEEPGGYVLSLISSGFSEGGPRTRPKPPPDGRGVAAGGEGAAESPRPLGGHVRTVMRSGAASWPCGICVSGDSPGPRMFAFFFFSPTFSLHCGGQGKSDIASTGSKGFRRGRFGDDAYFGWG